MLWLLGTNTHQNAGAWYQVPVCNADHHVNCATPTPTPTKNPCTYWKWKVSKFEADCITPTVTPIPTASPSPSLIPTDVPSDTPPPVQTGSGDTGGTPQNQPPGVCSASLPGDVPNFTVVTNPAGLELEWAIVPNADHILIRYGLQDGDWIFGAVNIPNTGNYVVQDLAENTPYFFQIAGGNGCAVGKWSGTVDPSWKRSR